MADGQEASEIMGIIFERGIEAVSKEHNVAMDLPRDQIDLAYLGGGRHPINKQHESIS